MARRRLRPVWRDPGIGSVQLREMRNDSQTGLTAGFRPKLAADDPLYRERVAVPTMEAIDAMPQAYRLLVHEFGYVDVYRAWRRGWSVKYIRMLADDAGGVFVMGV